MFNRNHPLATSDHQSIADYVEYREAGGSFMTALVTAVFKADLDNRAKLESAFPGLITAYRDWLHARGPFERPVTEQLPVSSLN